MNWWYPPIVGLFVSHVRPTWLEKPPKQATHVEYWTRVKTLRTRRTRASQSFSLPSCASLYFTSCELHVRRVLSGRCVRGVGVKSGDWYWSRLANLDFRTSQASPWFVAGVRRCHIVTTKEVHMLTCYSLWSTVIVGLPRALTRTLTYSSSSSRLGHKAALPRTKFLK